MERSFSEKLRKEEELKSWLYKKEQCTQCKSKY